MPDLDPASPASKGPEDQDHRVLLGNVAAVARAVAVDSIKATASQPAAPPPKKRPNGSPRN